MNLQQILLCLAFFVMYVNSYKPSTITVKCDSYACKAGYEKYENTSECIFTMCRNACKNGECEIHYCYGFQQNLIITKSTFEYCKHFLTTNKCDNCHCFKGEICICKTGYVINIKDQARCEPYCSQSCENGFCSAPETCDCNPGYKLSPNKYKCISKCSPPCDRSYCNEKGVCECHHNYDLRNSTCVPKENTTPKSCGQGYELQNNKNCKPVCEPECASGMICIAPNNCRCPRNQKFNKNTDQCELHCRTCVNGTLENGICMCNEEYKTNPNTSCECISKCSPPCHNGYCSRYGKCKCKSNYKWNNITSKCEEKCKCFNGHCENGKCICKEEYKHDPNNEHLCISKCPPRCFNGDCSKYGNCTCICVNGKPENGICMCDEGYKTNPNTSCECISKCSPPCRNGLCSGYGECTCTSNYKWNDITSKCEPKCEERSEGKPAPPKLGTCKLAFTRKDETLKFELQLSSFDNEACISTHNETFSCAQEFMQCVNHTHHNVSHQKGENATELEFEMGEQLTLRDMCESVTHLSNHTFRVFKCNFTCNHTSGNGNAFYENMEPFKSSNSALYLIPICVTLFVVILIVTGIIIRNTLKKRKLSTNPEGGTSTSTLQKKSDDEEIVENVELYGSI